MAKPITLEEMARQAIDGDREALEGLVRVLQADVYGLSLRMLWNREDAEDATQEILGLSVAAGAREAVAAIAVAVEDAVRPENDRR